ncbi:SDR family oxidoreductase [Fodinicurvata sp. EGI_FJ10296]|uniref:SDR family oxidoreductase n=1 Tax=Fodinicurvata sp. EGI_FJ10296 TaxID=3231908 RepID=UPI0034515501
MRLKDKVAIVTGGGGGFGEGIARRYADEGARVVVADINGDAAGRVAADIAAKGGTSVAVTANVAVSADVERMIDETLAAFGGLDIVVNNAGTTHRNGPILDITEEQFDRVFDVNVKSLYLTAKFAIPVFRKAGSGVFVNIASTAGIRPRPGLVWYNATKGAAITATKGMAAELGKDNIRVVAINPVMGETGLTDDFIGGDSPEKRAKVIEGIPLGRLSTPLDVANAALFLASDEAAFLTGVCLEVDGGRCV